MCVGTLRARHTSECFVDYTRRYVQLHHRDVVVLLIIICIHLFLYYDYYGGGCGRRDAGRASVGMHELARNGIACTIHEFIIICVFRVHFIRFIHSHHLVVWLCLLSTTTFSHCHFDLCACDVGPERVIKSI